LGSVKERNTFIFSKDTLNHSKSDNKTFIVQHNLWFCGFSIHQRILKNNISHNYEAATVINTDNNHIVCLDHHMRVVSEGSCDTEDWSNDASIIEINYTLLYIQNSIVIFTCIFDQINAASVSNLKPYRPQTCK